MTANNAPDAIADALVHLDDALDALTIDAWRLDERGGETKMPRIETTIAIELERVDCAIGPKGKSMFGTLALEIKRAVEAIEAARQSLQNGAPTPEAHHG